MEKTASNFDSVMVLKQMKYAGLFEAIRVRAQGFSYRKPHDQFFNRYKVILSKDHRKVAHDSKDTSKRCKMILEDIKLMNHKDVQVGFSKVFFRSSILNVLETQREKSMMEFTLMLQCVARGIIAKKIYRRMREVLNRAKRTIASGDAKQMEESINYAKSMRVQIFILKQLEVAHQQAKEEERISKLLEEAINLKEAEYLDAAIEQVNKIVPKKETTKKLVSEAKKTRENLVSHERVRKQLKNAMLEENLDMLKKAVSEAKSVGFPANLLREPQELLTRLDKEEHVFKNILAAIKDDDVAHVEKLIEQTKGSNLNDDRTRVLKKAREFIFDFHTQTLKSKIKSEDVIGVMKEIKRIKEKKLASKLQDIMAEAYDFIEQKKKENPEKDYDLGDADDGTSTPPRKRDKHEKEKSRYSDEDDDNAYEREGKESHSSSHGNASDEPEWLMLSKTSMDNSKLAPLLLKQKLKNAIAQNDLELVASLLPQLESSGITDLSKTYRLGKAMLQQTSQSKVIASNIQKALNDLDREKLKELLSQARDADMEPDDNILKARKICFGCSDEEFRALLMQKYIEKKEISKIQTLIAECVKLGTSKSFYFYNFA
jgi:myosin heavy subunit